MKTYDLRPSVALIAFALFTHALACVVHSAAPPAFRGEAVTLRVWRQLDTVELERRDGRWLLTRENVPADDQRVETSLNWLSQVAAGAGARPVETRADGDYGLDPVDATGVRIGFARGDSVVMFFGRSTPDFVGVYWKFAGAAEPVRRLDDDARPYSAEYDYWLYRLMLPGLTRHDIVALDVSWRDEAGRKTRYKMLKPAADSILLVFPDTLTLPLRQNSPLFEQATHFAYSKPTLAGERVPGPEVPPAVTVTLTLHDGRVLPLSARPGQAFDSYYIPHPATGRIVKVPRGYFDVFRQEVAFLKALPVYGPEEDDGVSYQPMLGRGVFLPHSHKYPSLEGLKEGAHDSHEGHDHSEDDPDDHSGHKH